MLLLLCLCFVYASFTLLLHLILNFISFSLLLLCMLHLESVLPLDLLLLCLHTGLGRSQLCSFTVFKKTKLVKLEIYMSLRARMGKNNFGIFGIFWSNYAKVSSHLKKVPKIVFVIFIKCSSVFSLYLFYGLYFFVLTKIVQVTVNSLCILLYNLVFCLFLITFNDEL